MTATPEHPPALLAAWAAHNGWPLDDERVTFPTNSDSAFEFAAFKAGYDGCAASVADALEKTMTTTKKLQDVKKGDWLKVRPGSPLIVAAEDAHEMKTNHWRFKVEQPAYCDNVEGPPSDEITLADVLPRQAVADALAGLRAAISKIIDDAEADQNNWDDESNYCNGQVEGATKARNALNEAIAPLGLPPAAAEMEGR